jgi:uncharacterized membrane protein
MDRRTEWTERARSSLFLLPLVAVVVGSALGAGMVALDSRLHDSPRLPFVFTSTVDSAREVLGTIAAATISFAGIAFSVALLLFQRSSAQYSPRVVHTLFRDPFNRRVVAVVVGTFTYCLIVLRSVRSAAGADGEAVVPDLSISLAMLLGIVTILSVVAFIDHAAHTLDVSEILERVTDDAIEQTRSASDGPVGAEGGAAVRFDLPEGIAAHLVRFRSRGWVQQLDLEGLVRLVPPDGGIVVHTAPGRYAVPGAPMCSVVGSIDDPDTFDRCLIDCVSLGSSRTLLQDPSFGLRQLVDVALRALSPGVNDPTTAQDAMFHATALLVELLRAAPPPRVLQSEHGGHVSLPEMPSHDELIDLTYDEVRRAAAPHPTVCVYLLESLHLVQLSTGVEPGRLERQARLVVEACAATDVVAADHRTVRDAYQRRFGRSTPTSGALTEVDEVADDGSVLGSHADG